MKRNMEEFFSLFKIFFATKSAMTQYLIEHTEIQKQFQGLCNLIIKKKYISETMLQRELKIDYYEAREIVKIFEDSGIVTPLDGIKPRKVIWTQFEILNPFFNKLNPKPSKVNP